MDNTGICLSEKQTPMIEQSEKRIFPTPLGKSQQAISSTLSSSSHQAQYAVRLTMPDVSEFLKSAPHIRAAKQTLEQRSGDMVEDIYTDSGMGTNGMRNKRRNYSYFVKRLFVSFSNETPDSIYHDKNHKDLSLLNDQKASNLEETFQVSQISKRNGNPEDEPDCVIGEQDEEDKIKSFGEESKTNLTKEEGVESQRKFGAKIAKERKMKEDEIRKNNNGSHENEGSSQKINMPENGNNQSTHMMNLLNSNNVSVFILPETGRILNQEATEKAASQLNNNDILGGGVSSKLNEGQLNEGKNIHEESNSLYNGIIKSNQHSPVHQGQSQSVQSQQNHQNILMRLKPIYISAWKTDLKLFGIIMLVITLIFILGLGSGLIGALLGNSQQHGWILCALLYPISGVLLLGWQFESVRLTLARLCVQVAAESAARLTLERELEYASYQKFYTFEHFRRVFRRVFIRTIIVCIIISWAASLLIEKAIITYIKRESANKPKDILIAEIFLRGFWLLPLLGVSYLFLQHERRIVRDLLRIDEGAANLDRNQLTGAFYDQFETEFAVVEAKIASGLKIGEQNAADVLARKAARKSARGAKLQLVPVSSEKEQQQQQQSKTSAILRQSELGENDSGIIIPNNVFKEEQSVIEKRAILRDWVWYWKRITSKDIIKLVFLHLIAGLLFFGGIFLALTIVSDFILDANEYGFCVAYGGIFVVSYTIYFFVPLKSSNQGNDTNNLLNSINKNHNNTGNILVSTGFLINQNSSNIQDWSSELLIASSISVGVTCGRLEQSKLSFGTIISVTVIKMIILFIVFCLAYLKRSCQIQSVLSTKSQKQSSSQTQAAKIKNLIMLVEQLVIVVIIETCAAAGIYGSTITLYGKLDYQLSQTIHQSHDFNNIYVALVIEMLGLNLIAFALMYWVNRAIKRSNSQSLKQFSFTYFLTSLIKQHFILLITFHLFAWQFIFFLVCN